MHLLKSILSGLFIFVAILILQGFSNWSNHPLLIAPFAATLVIIFVTPKSPYLELQHIVGGYLLSAIIGIFADQHIHSHTLAISLGTAISITLMLVTHTTHPPAAGLPILVITSHAGWKFLFTPILVATAIMVIMNICHRYALERKWMEI